MNFAFSEEQDAFRESLRRFLAEKSPSSEIFRLTETAEGYDPAVWKQMAEELGLQGIHIPEAYGGQGFGFLELGIALEEMGRALLCSPFFSTVCLAANAILNAGSETQKQAWLPGIASGETTATLALLDRDTSGWEPDDVTLAYTRDGEAALATGSKRLVTDAATADLFVIAARASDSGDLGLLVLRRDDPGVEVTEVPAIDPTRRLANLALDGARAEILAEGPDAAAALTRTLHQARSGLASESVGVAERCLEAAVEYAKQRVQFGRSIGSFQAIKHKCAEVLLEIENARVAAHYASWAAAEDSDDLALAASVAKSFCADALVRAATENVQIHGGIGYTWEADPQLLYKRARFNLTLLGDGASQRARIAELRGF